jgi:hypothetical protein
MISSPSPCLDFDELGRGLLRTFNNYKLGDLGRHTEVEHLSAGSFIEEAVVI